MKTLFRILTAFLPTRELRHRAYYALCDYAAGYQPRRTGRVASTVAFTGCNKVNSQTTIGDYCKINGLVTSGVGPVRIGRHCQIAPEVLIMTQNHDYDDGDAIPYGRGTRIRGVRIADFVWIGQRVTLLPGSDVGEGAIVQAGSVVHGRVEPMSIVGGNPAKAFARRDAAHFNALKAAGRFLT